MVGNSIAPVCIVRTQIRHGLHKQESIALKDTDTGTSSYTRSLSKFKHCMSQSIKCQVSLPIYYSL